MAILGLKPRRESVEDTVASILGSAGDIEENKIPSSGTGPKASDILNRQKFKYEMLKDQMAAEQTAKQRQALTNLYTSGAYTQPNAANLAALEQLGSISEQGIRGQLASSLAGLGEGFTAAQNLTASGYQALQDYLGRAQPDAYRGVSVEAPQVTNALEQALLSQGAMNPDVQAQLEATNLGLQSGTQQYRNLLNTLSAISQSEQAQRLAEAQMASNVATTGLSQTRAQYEAQLQASAMSALNQLAQQMATQRYQETAAAAAAREELRQKLIAAGIDVDALDNPVVVPEDTPLTPQQAAVANAATLRQAAAAFAPRYTKKNPNATLADIRRTFPKLAEAFAAKAK